MSLMERMKVASDLQNMSMGEKMLGSIQVAIFGIAIVFLALLLLFVIITVLEKVLHGAEDKNKASVAKKAEVSAGPVKVEEAQEEEEVDDTQLVAVITAAIAASLHTSTHNIVVRNIIRVPDTTPAWNKLGRMQQVNRIE
ncbi:sodium pump decarboxylases, gamma subunit [Natronincola peptidivorans]|uniref:Sodium pump decarboxylases, gamma subunit n=1 Tax=Natronincola peptidivorans TaxID=426128 RepID=A0A1I0HB86_9FIRM|nr:OadG family transporter subunit [Natronincola peptidivorans]SET81046.1 sodium pump decarboxylases, gamma subunit [Natronincola peptidivorans]